MATVIFRRSDAMAVEHGEIEDLTIETQAEVQLTYSTLRDSLKDKDLGEINRNTGAWYADDGDGWIGPFSDVIITP